MGCCTGSQFAPAPDAALDPSQRVNFTFGMVLGVDDFRQEHAYLAGRDERALRETIGYGVIRGLQVAAPAPVPASAGQQVRVAPGMALTPDGHLVAVRAEQCANLGSWLAAELVRDATTANQPTVYVVLRHAELSGTPVPIPGEPCRDESALQADARIGDSFSIDFSWTAPAQGEDDAVRSVAAWIRAIKVLDVAPASVPMAQFQLDVEAGLKQVIAASWPAGLRAPLADTPRGADPSAVVTPPKVPSIPRAAYSTYLNAAFEVWVRLMRSGLMAHHGPVPDAEALAERGLLLAGIDVRSVGGVPPAAELPRVRMLGRAELLHLRMLQEWVLRDGEQDAPREAHYLLGKPDVKLGHAQDLLRDFERHDHAIARVDIVPDTTDGGSGEKAVLRAAVKWPGGIRAAGGPDYYGPDMSQPIPVVDGGTGQREAPALGALLVGRAAVGPQPATFVLGAMVGAALTKPAGPSPNILVDVSGGAPNIRLDTVQDIGTTASPTFTGLTLTTLDVNDSLITQDLLVEHNASVQGNLSIDGELVLAQPLSSVLATDKAGEVIAAVPWDGDEQALAKGPPAPYVYAPGQPQPVRVEDGGTGLAARPQKMQILVGVDKTGLRRGAGEYVQARLVAGQNINLSLLESRITAPPGSEWQLTLDAASGGISAVLAAGNAANPPSLTAVTQGSQTVIDAVQPLHPAATPQFVNVSLSQPSSAAPDALLGWNKASGELVIAPAQAPSTTDVGQWAIRYVRDARELVVSNKDHVVVSLVSGQIDLPDITRARISEGRVVVIKAGPGADVVNVDNHDLGTLGLKTGGSVTVIAARGLDKPAWLVIGRS